MSGESGYTRREWLMVIGLSTVTFTTGLCASLQAPFYPKEAEKKGASATEYGVVFGVFELVAFLSSPIYGKYMGNLGASFVLKVGMVVTGVSTILFGLLDLVMDHWSFISLSFILRIIESLGTTAVVTASLSIVVLCFPEAFAKMFSILEVLFGLGFMLGPTVGGFLFGAGGFMVPFFTVGILILISSVFVCVVLPHIEDLDGKLRTKVPISSVMKIVPVSLAALCIMVEAMSFGFLETTLEPHLRQFNLSPPAVGTMFIMDSMMYTFFCIIVGKLCDKKYDTNIMVMLGSVLVIGAFILIGPLPYTYFDTNLWMVRIGLMIDGVGMSFIVVSAFVSAMVSAVKYGCPDDISTFSMVSGIYVSAFSLGAFIGPSVAGVLLDNFGFRKSTLFVIAIHLFMALLMLCFSCCEKRYERKMNAGVLGYGDSQATGNDSAERRALILTDINRDKCIVHTSKFKQRKIKRYNSTDDNNSMIYTHTC